MSKNKNDWWAKIREGLVRDPGTPHYKRMGSAIWVYLNLHMGADWETGQLSRTHKTISDETGIPESTVRKMMDKLKKPPPGETEGYIKVRQLSRSLHIQITKWESVKKKKRVPVNGQSKNGEGAQIRKTGCPNQERVPKSGHSLSIQNNGSKPARVPVNGQPNETHIRDPKDIYTVFQFWNDQEITVHREFKKFKSCINARLKHYTKEELCQAIKNYTNILNSQDHFFSYRWTLSDFLTRKNGLDRFMDREAAFENFRKNGSSVSQPEAPEETEEEKEDRRKRQDAIFEANAKRLESTR